MSSLTTTTTTTPGSKPTQKTTITTTNIIASINLNTTINLKFLALTSRNIEYSSKKIGCAFIRIPQLRITAFIFKQGRIIVSGAKNELTSRYATRYIARYIQLLGHPSVTYTNYHVIAYHCMLYTPFMIDINQFIAVVGTNKATLQHNTTNSNSTRRKKLTRAGASNNPSSSLSLPHFNLCHYRHSADVTMIIAPGGKVSVKATSIEVATASIKNIYPVLISCRLYNNTNNSHNIGHNIIFNSGISANTNSSNINTYNNDMTSLR